MSGTIFANTTGTGAVAEKRTMDYRFVKLEFRWWVSCWSTATMFAHTTGAVAEKRTMDPRSVKIEFRWWVISCWRNAEVTIIIGFRCITTEWA
jgi:hypothetical protein